MKKLGSVRTSAFSLADRKLVEDIPPDDEATLARARREAAARLRMGETRVMIRRAVLKLPSGVKGERYYCLGSVLVALFGLNDIDGVEIHPVSKERNDGKARKETTGGSRDGAPGLRGREGKSRGKRG